MKRILYVFISIIGLFILSGCSSKNLADYIVIDFNGMDTKGTATYYIDEENLYNDVFKLDSGKDVFNDELWQEMDAVSNSYTLDIDKDSDLSNGEKVVVSVTVDKDKTKKVKGGKKEFEVKGLEKPKKLTSKEVEKGLVVNFVGYNGKGEVQLDNTLDEPLNSVSFTFKNDGELKNGDKASIEVNKDLENELSAAGYILEKDFKVSFEVSNLKNVAEKATDIANLEDIKRMVDEGIHRKYQDSSADYSFGSKYEIKQEKLMYRQFKKDTSDDDLSFWSSGSDNGNLIGIYTIKEYSGGADSKLRSQFTAIYGFSDIVLDGENNANVAEIVEISDTKDDTYSLESVLKLYEGYGYKNID